MNLEQLKYIVEVANSGSISTAAQKLHVSQPSISQSIVNLEKELNTRIFKRSRSGTQPTEEGKLIIERAREILSQVNDLTNLSQSHSSYLTGSISVSFIPSLCVSLLPKMLGVYKQKHPKVKLYLSEAGSNLAAQQVIDGKIDLGLVSSPDVSVYHDQKLSFIPLMLAEVQVCVGSKSPLASKDEISVKEMIQYPILSFNEKYAIHSFIQDLFKPYGQPNILFSSENSEVAKSVIAENLAIGFYTNISLKTDPYIQNNLIVPLRIKELKNTYFHTGIIHLKNTHLSLATQSFIEEIRLHATHFKKLYGIADQNEH